MILLPKDYSPATLVGRLEESEIFCFSWRNWLLQSGKRYQAPYIIGPRRRFALPTPLIEVDNLEVNGVYYMGIYLRTGLEYT